MVLAHSVYTIPLVLLLTVTWMESKGPTSGRLVMKSIVMTCHRPFGTLLDSSRTCVGYMLFLVF